MKNPKSLKKCLIMFSGGLDSRLALKIMQSQGFEITALYFNLPFGTGCCNSNCSFNFSQLSGVKLEIFDCTQGKLLKEYLEVLKNPKYGRGVGINPCIDCRIFMLKKAKEYADKQKIKLIVTGEVLDERPMSQYKKAMKLIEKESGLNGRILRPLSAKLLEETEFEKKGIVNRNKLYKIQGRRRVEQMKLAEKFKINYPTPAGGCLLCEKNMKNRLDYLIKKGLNEDEIKLAGIGRHYIIDKCWIVFGRNEKENKIIEKLKGKYRILECNDFAGPSAVIFNNKNNCNKKTESKVFELMKAYSKDKNPKKIKGFEKYKI